MIEQEILPKPQTDLPLPEKEITSEFRGSTPKSRLLKIGAVIVIIIFVLSLTFVLGKNSTNNPGQISPTPTPGDMTGSGKLTPGEPQTDETADWLTFSSKEEEISFQYPPDWKFNNLPCVRAETQEPTECVHIISPKRSDSPYVFSVYFQANDDPENGLINIIEVLPLGAKGSNKPLSVITISTDQKNKNLVDGLFLTDSSVIVGQSNTTLQIKSQKNEKDFVTLQAIMDLPQTQYNPGYTLSQYKSHPDYEKVIQIFKSIKYSTDSSANTTNWKTYINTKNNLRLKYPTSYLVEEDFSLDSSYDVHFFSSVTEKSEFDKCKTRDGIECNDYSLGIKFDSKNKAQATSLESFLKDQGEASSKYISLIVGGSPALQNQFKGIGIVNNTYVDRGTSVFHIFANSISNENENMTIFNKMLTTFKFTR